jgi:hypothetical protein
VALDFADRALHKAKEEYAEEPGAYSDYSFDLVVKARVLESLGRLDEAMALDAEWSALHQGKSQPKEALMRRAIKHMAAGEDAEAEQLLRSCITLKQRRPDLLSSKTIEGLLKSHIMLAELLERKGTEEALAEARTLRDDSAQQLARHEAGKGPRSWRRRGRPLWRR